MKHIFVTIRYSVLSEDKAKAWVLGRGDFDEYRRKLFDSERLKSRHELFKKITLPSLVNQTVRPSKDWLTVFLLVSEEMPHEHLRNLENLVRNYDWISIVSLPISSTKLNSPVLRHLKRTHAAVTYATVRLDDDDALAENYCERLLTYVEEHFSGFCISFGKGVAALIGEDQTVNFKAYYAPKLAAGLAFIQHKPEGIAPRGKTVYELGNHTKVDLNIPTILDSRSVAFLRTVHLHADTASDNNLLKYTKLPTLLASDVEKSFKLDSEIFQRS